MSDHDLSCNAHDVPWGTGMCSCKGRLRRDLAARDAGIERLGKIIDDLCDAAMAARSFANAEADDGTVLAIDLAVEAARKEQDDAN